MIIAPLITDAELSLFREEATARMNSRVKLWRLSGKAAQDEDTGLEGPTWVAVQTDLPFRLRRSSLAGSSNGTRRVTIAGIMYQMSIADGSFPYGTDIRDNDLIEVISGEHPGSVWKIVEAAQQDQQTAVRVPIIEVQRPQEWPT